MTPASAPTTSLATRRVPGTRLPVYVFDTNVELARLVAGQVAAVIRERNSAGQKAVLGLPTGSTPVGIYRELIRMHRDEGLDLSRVVTFNLDEYYGLGPDQLQSYARWMHEHFFRHVNIRPENIHIPDGRTPAAEIDDYCRRYEDAIEAAGGIDVQLLGVGRNGHIGFNEPFSPRNGRTRLVTLDVVTRRDAASDFFSEDNVPPHALTMGIGSIAAARKIILVALGEHKARVVRELSEGPVTEKLPASFLQEHADAVVYVDAAAGGELTGVATPWVVGPVEWTDAMIKRAVLQLCRETGKGLLKLNDDDFRDRNLHGLLSAHGPAHKLGHRVFRMMMDTIQYHPAGKQRKRVICFSPHPDDDVISMGGGLIRLVEDGHEVHVAYMTTGNIAVFDHDAAQLADLAAEFNRLFGFEAAKSRTFREQVDAALQAKKPGQPDVEIVRRLKTLIRWSEAKAGAFVCGCKEEHLHFLDLPFYRTGTIEKNPVGPDDVRIIRELLERVRPDQIYVAGDLSDPHGTHRVCAEAIFNALWEMREAGLDVPEVLLYRGAWQEWPAHEIEIALPLSPRDLDVKKQAIFRHESQKDDALFPGSDEREFWQRAEDRNRNTAALYDKFGLPEYYALEGYVRWKWQPL